MLKGGGSIRTLRKRRASGLPTSASSDGPLSGVRVAARHRMGARKVVYQTPQEARCRKVERVQQAVDTPIVCFLIELVISLDDLEVLRSRRGSMLTALIFEVSQAPNTPLKPCRLSVPLQRDLPYEPVPIILDKSLVHGESLCALGCESPPMLYAGRVHLEAFHF